MVSLFSEVAASLVEVSVPANPLGECAVFESVFSLQLDFLEGLVFQIPFVELDEQSVEVLATHPVIFELGDSFGQAPEGSLSTYVIIEVLEAFELQVEIVSLDSHQIVILLLVLEHLVHLERLKTFSFQTHVRLHKENLVQTPELFVSLVELEYLLETLLDQESVTRLLGYAHYYVSQCLVFLKFPERAEHLFAQTLPHKPIDPNFKLIVPLEK